MVSRTPSGPLCGIAITGGAPPGGVGRAGTGSGSGAGGGGGGGGGGSGVAQPASKARPVTAKVLRNGMRRIDNIFPAFSRQNGIPDI
ncbi:hypothetical protein D6851_09940 [Altericroceibacterium spongiae]|uniref:Uncharacterized protein n=1 Tax=Altericroceibacterium spongiae TaxID=2320269 RepID=A0A420EKK5_9SPHN|nr:hypothetical protein D6851_09940 [Altericroceibacterium spongiae]